MKFVSPTRGPLSLEDVFADILQFASRNPDDDYSLIVGTDSQLKENRGEICFVTALIVHRKGKGGRFFYLREIEPMTRSLRQRIFYETSRSLMLA